MTAMHAFAEELVEAGLSVAAAASADDASPPSCIITDVNLCSGMDGIALVGEAHRPWPRVCLVVVSGNASSLERLAPGSCERAYVKPFDPRRLAAKVQRRVSCAA